MKCKILRDEIEKMLKDQLEISEVIWNKDGSVNVELDLAEIKKKQTNETHYHTYPIYVEPIRIKPYSPYWSITTSSSKPLVTYCSPTITSYSTC